MLPVFLLLSCSSSPVSTVSPEPAPAAKEAPSAQPSAQAPAEPTAERVSEGRMAESDVEGLAAHLKTGGLLFDVRTPEEYAEGHVPGAKSLPLQELESRAGEIPRDQGEVFLICRSGARSGRAGAALAKQGYQVTNVLGGTLAWIEAGKPVE